MIVEYVDFLLILWYTIGVPQYFIWVIFMRYKTYKFRYNDRLNCRTGSDGYQPKFLSKDNKYFIKCQCKLSGVYVDDWKVEIIASMLCDYFKFYHIAQRPCRVFIDNVELMGVESENFGYNNIRFLSFENILEQIGHSSNEDWFVRTDAVGKIKNMSVMISQACKTLFNSSVDAGLILDYMIKCAVIDILVYNNDRHTRNYHIQGSANGVVSVAPMHDFGMGLFENDADFRNCNTWQECNRYCYIAPFGEDAFDLLEMLDSAFNVKSWLRRYSRPEIHYSKFPSKKAYDYFKEIRGRIW